MIVAAIIIPSMIVGAIIAFATIFFVHRERYATRFDDWQLSEAEDRSLAERFNHIDPQSYQAWVLSQAQNDDREGANHD